MHTQETERLMANFANPMRGKILLELFQQPGLSARQLQQRLPELPQATLYRHLKKMEEEGVLRVSAERRVRGTVERSYEVNADLGRNVQQLLEQNRGDVYLLLFTQYMAALLQEFRDYAARPDIDIQGDGSGFSVGPFYADDGELKQLMRDIGALLEPHRSNDPPLPGRRLRSIGIVITPPTQSHPTEEEPHE